MELKLKQFVSYAGHGIGQVTEIKTMHEMEFYAIDILHSGLKILIPKSSNDLVRPLMDRNTAKLCLLYTLESHEYKPDNPGHNWKRRFDHLLEKIKSNDPLKIAEVVAELNIKKFEGENLSFGERKMLDAAKVLIQTEIDLVLK